MKTLLIALITILAGCTTTTTTLPVPHSKADCETTGIGGDACHLTPSPPALSPAADK